MFKSLEQTQCFARTMDEGRSFLKNVFRQPADIIPNVKEGRLEIRFHTMSTRRENKALKELCDVVNEENFLYPGTDLRLVFRAA